MQEKPNELNSDSIGLELLTEAKQGNEDAKAEIVRKCKRIIKWAGTVYKVPGNDYQDLEQEASIAVLKAIRDYRPEYHISFYSFAHLCVKRHMITVLKTATRQKHKPLNEGISLDSVPLQNTQRPLIELIPVYDTPERIIMEKEKEYFLMVNLSSILSPLERAALDLRLKGYDYKASAETLGRSIKAIDNALHRVRKKLSAVLDEI